MAKSINASLAEHWNAQAEFRAQKLGDVAPQDTAVAEFALKGVDDPAGPAHQKRLVEAKALPFDFDVFHRNPGPLGVLEG